MPKNEKEIQSLEGEISKPNFWQNQEKANNVIKTLKTLKIIRDPFLNIESQYKELEELLSITDQDDTSSLSHLKGDLQKLKVQLDAFEFKSLLNQKEDSLNAILSINAGAGGTEATDWANMLLRMYTKWAEKRSYVLQFFTNTDELNRYL